MGDIADFYKYSLNEENEEPFKCIDVKIKKSTWLVLKKFCLDNDLTLKHLLTNLVEDCVKDERMNSHRKVSQPKIRPKA